MRIRAGRPALFEQAIETIGQLPGSCPIPRRDMEKPGGVRRLRTEAVKGIQPSAAVWEGQPRRSTSRRGGSPNRRLYSRLNWVGLS